MKYEYLLVGFGLAGMAFAAELEKAGKSFLVIDDNENIPERIVGGMYNPVILKRFTPAWKAHTMWQTALPFYRYLEKKFNKTYIYPLPVYRILHSVEEQNNWIVASDKAVMCEYMESKISKEKIDGIEAPYGYGKLKNTGRVNGEQLLNDYRNHLKEKNRYLQQTFDYNKLFINKKNIQYHHIEARQIVFSEGVRLHKNPFFNFLPMRETKGEMLIVEVLNLQMDFILKAGIFMLPFAPSRFVVGATYNWEDKTLHPTKEAQRELEEKLQRFLKLPYKIIGHKVGIRPTIKDRRPIIGKHPEYTNLTVLNGLGTRGIIIAPTIAKTLYDHLEKGKEIPKEMHSNRFTQSEK